MNPDRFSDLRVLRWFDRIDGILAGETIGPIRANIDLTNLCNHGCPWCEPLAFREETIKDKRHTLSTEVALQVLDDLAAMDCKTINFSGGGEPLLHKEFGTILKFAASLHLRTWIVTNGSLMHKWMSDLAIADHVRISLDASNGEEHKEMHGRDEFLYVMENIVQLCKQRVSRSPEMGIAYIVADCNSSTHSLHRILELASDAGVDFVQFRPLSEEKPERFTGDWHCIAGEIERMAHKYPKVQVWPLGKRGKDVFLQREFSTCYSALTNAVISANGDVVACCDERTKIFGNVNEQSFRSIWLSARHRERAEAIERKLCSRCLMCGYNRAVEKFVVNNEALPELV